MLRAHLSDPVEPEDRLGDKEVGVSPQPMLILDYEMNTFLEAETLVWGVRRSLGVMRQRASRHLTTRLSRVAEEP